MQSERNGAPAAALALALLLTSNALAEDFSPAFIDALRAIPGQHWATLNANRIQNAWPEVERRQFSPVGERVV